MFALVLGLAPMAHADPGPNGCYAYLGGVSGPTAINAGASEVTGITGAGTWTVKVIRPGVTDPIVYRSPSGGEPTVEQGVLKIGDKVSCTTGNNGVVIAGRVA